MFFSKSSWKRLQRNNFLSSKTPSRRFLKIFSRSLQDILNMSWKTKKCYAEDVFKTSSRHFLKTSPRHILKTSSRRLQDQQMFAGELKVWISSFLNIRINILQSSMKNIRVLNLITFQAKSLQLYWKGTLAYALF